MLQSNACEEQRNQLEKEMKKLEKASREIANKMKKKKGKKKTGKKKQFSLRPSSWLLSWLIKFSKPQTNHCKNLIKCVKKIVYYFYKNKVVCLQFYNHFFISSFSQNSFLCFTFLLLFLHFHNVLLCTLYTWGGKSPENLKLAMH